MTGGATFRATFLEANDVNAMCNELFSDVVQFAREAIGPFVERAHIGCRTAQ